MSRPYRSRLTPEQRSASARKASEASWAKTVDRSARTAPARAAAAAALVRRTTAEQDLPEVVDDQVVCARCAAIVKATP